MTDKIIIICAFILGVTIGYILKPVVDWKTVYAAGILAKPTIELKSGNEYLIVFKSSTDGKVYELFLPE